jgi:hypothetical protein
MTFRFVLFLVSHFFLRTSHLLFPLAFDLLASLRASPIAPGPLLLAFHFCLPLRAAPPHYIVDGH